MRRPGAFVSGVVLANASLDIAFHDTVLIDRPPSLSLSEREGGYRKVALFIPGPHPSSLIHCHRQWTERRAIKKNEDSKESDAEYIKMFWVGLMDGDGSIQVNH